jgi:hypothetical protein
VFVSEGEKLFCSAALPILENPSQEQSLILLLALCSVLLSVPLSTHLSLLLSVLRSVLETRVYPSSIPSSSDVMLLALDCVRDFFEGED